MTSESTGRGRRWAALYVLCLGVLMIVLDTTIVNVALPSIRTDLRFTETDLVWVVNAYMLTFGGFLLLGGRLGDLYGHRRLFLAGIVLFTGASLASRSEHSRGSRRCPLASPSPAGASAPACLSLWTRSPERSSSASPCYWAGGRCPMRDCSSSRRLTTLSASAEERTSPLTAATNTSRPSA